VQPRYNLLFRQIERELLPLCSEEGLAVIPYNPMAGGMLTGKYKLDQKPNEGRFTPQLGNAGAMYAERYWHEREFATIGKLQAIAAESGHSLAQLSIAWVMANPAITSAIIGASRADQLTETLAAADVRLDAGLKAKLDDVSVEYRWGDAAR
jgi:aryl-alcohol dehydrogenase-like predicted oxidoreductase